MSIEVIAAIVISVLSVGALAFSLTAVVKKPRRGDPLKLFDEAWEIVGDKPRLPDAVIYSDLYLTADEVARITELWKREYSGHVIVFDSGLRYEELKPDPPRTIGSGIDALWHG